MWAAGCCVVVWSGGTSCICAPSLILQTLQPLIRNPQLMKAACIPCCCTRFHEVEPLSGLSMMPPSRVSKAVVMGGSRRVPWARLGENTLLLADELVVTQAADGRWFLVVRWDGSCIVAYAASQPATSQAACGEQEGSQQSCCHWECGEWFDAATASVQALRDCVTSGSQAQHCTCRVRPYSVLAGLVMPTHLRCVQQTYRCSSTDTPTHQTAHHHPQQQQ